MIKYHRKGGEKVAKIVILKDPGFVYDLNFVFYLKFNQKLYIENLANKERKREDSQFFSDLQKNFGYISDDLYVFYHAVENGRCFMFKEYVVSNKDRFLTDFNLKFFVNEFNDEEKLIRKLLKFYLYNLSDKELEECMCSQAKLFAHIKETEYSGDEKSKLYEFFVDPKPYIRKLQYELMDKAPLLDAYHKLNYDKMIETHNNMDFKTLRDMMFELQDLSFLDNNEEQLYISYCLLNKYIIDFVGLEDGVFYFLGYDYISILEKAKKKVKNFNLEGFGQAFGDESRVKIFNFILNNGEVTCKDLEKEFDFSGSTSYHHITMMTRTGVLQTRNEGKTVYYSINFKYIDRIIDTFVDVSKRRKG